METTAMNMDAFLNMLMKMGGLGAVIFVFLGGVYAWALKAAKDSVEPVEPEPGDEVHSLPYEDGDTYHGFK